MSYGTSGDRKICEMSLREVAYRYRALTSVQQHEGTLP